MAPKTLTILAFASVYLIWAHLSRYLSGAIRSMPRSWAGTRFLFAGLILYTGARLTGAPFAGRTGEQR
jgi:hypothetical protein